MGLRSPEEFQLVLDDLGMKGAKGEAAQSAFAAYLARLDLINGSTEDA